MWQEDSRDSVVKAATNLPLAIALLVAVVAAAMYQMLDKLTVKRYGAATTKVFQTVGGRWTHGRVKSLPCAGHMQTETE